MDPVSADFAAADDLLREATQGRLADRGSIVIEKTGRIGPSVEIALASLSFADQYSAVSINSSFARSLVRALEIRASFGSGFNDRAGAFPLSAINPVTAAGTEWDQWTTHAENAAKAQGLNANLVSGLLGALVEIQDNVYEHSKAPETGVVAYATTSNSFEFVVADRGIGVLSSLRQNAAYSNLTDAGAALRLAKRTAFRDFRRKQDAAKASISYFARLLATTPSCGFAAAIIR